MHYAITVLADPNFANMAKPETRDEGVKQRIEALAPVALFPGYAINVVEGNLNNFDSRGNFTPSIMRELVYSARPAQKVVAGMEKRGVNYKGSGRATIDKLLLTGYWTPIGLVENALASGA